MRDGYGVALWKAIRKDCDLLISMVSFLVGNVRRVRFWKDKWCKDKPLCVTFLSLFALVVSKEVWMVDVWN